jgi:hypothetical protein
MKLEANSKQVEQNENLQNIKKKTKVIGAPPFDWPWFEHFDNIFSNIAKINYIPNATYQGVGVMNFEIKFVNISDEQDVVQTLWMLNSLKKQTFVFGVKINCSWLLCLQMC